MHTETPLPVPCKRAPWNKGRLIGQKRPLKPKDVWAIRVRLQLQGRKRDLALFNLAIDSKLRGCDLVRLQVDEVCAGGRVRDRGTVIQKRQGDRSSSKSPSRPTPDRRSGRRFARGRQQGSELSLRIQGQLIRSIVQVTRGISGSSRPSSTPISALMW